MSDELDRLLRQGGPRRPAATPLAQPKLRVQGGLPLEGGPRLDREVAEAARLLTHHPAQRPAGPHLVTPASSGHANFGLRFDAAEVGQSAGTAVESHAVVASAPLSAPPESPALSPSLPVHSAPVSPPPLPAHTSSPPPPQAAAERVLHCVHLKKSYHKGKVEVPVLREVTLGVNRGEFLAIVGQSGSGKSTLLHLLGTLDVPDSGQIYFQDQRIDRLTRSARDHLRNRHFGMIFQFYHLLPELTTLENVLTPLMIGCSLWQYLRQRGRHRDTAVELLQLVGLDHRLKHKPAELSGGEMQRAAIARALVARPQILLADEPTGNLDQATGHEIMKILRTLNRDQKLTIVMVTHDQAIAAQADRIVRLTDGRIEGAAATR